MLTKFYLSSELENMRNFICKTQKGFLAILKETRGFDENACMGIYKYMISTISSSPCVVVCYLIRG